MAPRSSNRVAIYHTNHDIRLRTQPTPAIGPGEVLLEVHASGICGSDLMEWYRRPRAPTVLGHEVAGVVVAVGDGVQQLQPGDRIVATHHVPCLACRYCLRGHETACETLRSTRFDPGGFAEYIRIPSVNVERGVLKLPPQVSDDAGSMVEPLGCVLRAQRKIGLRAGESVLLVGAGVSGSMNLLAAKAKGAAPVFVTDIQPERRRSAERLGADRVLDPADDVGGRIRAELGRGADHVIVCAGAASAIATGLAAVDQGGTVCLFAPLEPEERYPLPFNRVFWQSDITLTSSYGSAPRDLQEALGLIAGDRCDLDRLVTHRLPLSQIQTGFEIMLKGGDSLKVIIDPRLDA
ncbi:MAG: alcohol dehydrogenase catalytic domain-containing protein [Gemmatimonadetes bacterium]|nr:alcohol dehydrogenase catalytic domain-containing protein [Gemmatimonadota bacterium]